jgi:hypothetical protein
MSAGGALVTRVRTLRPGRLSPMVLFLLAHSLALTSPLPRKALPRIALPRTALPMHLRGGAIEMSLANYANEASGLFGNMGGAAAFLAGGLVPLSTFAAPSPADGDSPNRLLLLRAHAITAASSLLSLLVSVMYATISNNKLREAVVAPTASLRALLMEGEYALPWLGCNAHFVLGLLGFATTVGLNIWLKFGGAVGKVVVCAVCSALLLMLSIVNDAAGQGAGSVIALLVRYVQLLVVAVIQGRRMLVLGSLGFAVAAAVLAIRACVLVKS